MVSALKPLLVFLAVGGLLFTIERQWNPPEIETIVILATELEEIRREWRKQMGRAPTESELEAAIQTYGDDEMLFREALRLGWDQNDPVIYRRLVQNMRFLEPELRLSHAELYQKARALGMHRTDIVVRRRLLQRARAATAKPLPPLPVHQAGNASGQVHVTQIFLSRDKRGEALETDATMLLEKLRGENLAPQAAHELSDPSLYKPDQPKLTERKLASRFGQGFLDALAGAELNTWIGPVASAYGLHAVWIHERKESGPPNVTRIPNSPRNDQALAAIRQRYRVEVSAE